MHSPGLRPTPISGTIGDDSTGKKRKYRVLLMLRSKRDYFVIAMIIGLLIVSMHAKPLPEIQTISMEGGNSASTTKTNDRANAVTIVEKFVIGKIASRIRRKRRRERMKHVMNAMMQSEKNKTSFLRKWKAELLREIEAKEMAVRSSEMVAGEHDPTYVMVFCYNRALYLERTMQSIERTLPTENYLSLGRIHVVVSQDGNQKAVEQLISQYRTRLGSASHWQHPPLPLIPKISPYVRLAAHYKWALDKAFNENKNLRRVIILEDDLELAVDFFEFMAAMAPILENDDMLMAVSAWNDHGQAKFVDGADPAALFRTDFFGGLGWMLSRKMWEELSPIWPNAYWDDWIRQPERRKNRQFIHPEISRTITFGRAGGASQGQYFSRYLQSMKLNDVRVNFTQDDDLPSRLSSTKFHDEFMKNVREAEVAPNMTVILSHADTEKALKIFYGSNKEYQTICRNLGMLDDIRSEVPRSGFQGIVPVRINRRRLYIVPHPNSTMNAGS